MFVCMCVFFLLSLNFVLNFNLALNARRGEVGKSETLKVPAASYSLPVQAGSTHTHTLVIVCLHK